MLSVIKVIPVLILHGWWLIDRFQATESSQFVSKALLLALMEFSPVKRFVEFKRKYLSTYIFYVSKMIIVY